MYSVYLFFFFTICFVNGNFYICDTNNNYELICTIEHLVVARFGNPLCEPARCVILI